MHFQHVFGQAFGIETRIAAVVFGLVVLAIAGAVIASWRRRRRGKPATSKAEHTRLELTYLLILSGVVAFVAATSLSANASFFSDPPPALTVKVTAFQWCWRFQYAGQPASVIEPCAGGPIPTLVLPAGRTVRVDLTSTDVIHSFWVPGLRFKLDAYPGHVNSFTFTLRDGSWLGHCAQFCGLFHAEMLFRLQAVPPAAFGRWLRAHDGRAS